LKLNEENGMDIFNKDVEDWTPIDVLHILVMISVWGFKHLIIGGFVLVVFVLIYNKTGWNFLPDLRLSGEDSFFYNALIPMIFLILFGWLLCCFFKFITEK